MAKGLINAHNMLKVATEIVAGVKTTQEWQLLYIKIATFVLCFSSLEGQLNWLGSVIAPSEWEDERSFFSKDPYKGTLGKLDFLCGKCSFIVKKGERPYQTIKTLHEIRNRLMHPKTETYQVEDNNHLIARIENLQIEDIKSDIFGFCEELQKIAARKYNVVSSPFGNVISYEEIPDNKSQLQIRVGTEI